VTASVGIVIAAYRASATIARAVRSALAEPEVAEVIVVDDASGDDTAANARAADDGSGRLRVFTQSVNAGPSAARNHAIEESTASWLGVLDADDFFVPGRMAPLVTHTDNADFIADDMWQVPHDSFGGPRVKLLSDSLTKACFVNLCEFLDSNVSRKGRLRGEMGFLKPLMSRTFLDEHRLRYQEGMNLGEDYELYCRALALGARFYLVPTQGYVSVVRPDSLSARHSARDLQLLRDCDNALAQAFSLSPAERKALRRHYLSVDCRLQWQRLIDAVKARDARAAMGTFLRPLPVPVYLFEKLADQMVIRTMRAVGLSRFLGANSGIAHRNRSASGNHRDG
jgi:succinoglycan biosynthesis protein ExoU